MTDRPFFDGLRTIIRQMHNLSTEELNPYGLSRFEMLVLLRVYEKDGILQKDIASDSGGEGLRIGNAVKSLKWKCYITRSSDKQDKRQNRLYITESGLALRDELLAIKQSVEQCILRCISWEDLLLLERILTNMKESLTRRDLRRTNPCKEGEESYVKSGY